MTAIRTVVTLFLGGYLQRTQRHGNLCPLSIEAEQTKHNSGGNGESNRPGDSECATEKVLDFSNKLRDFCRFSAEKVLQESEKTP